MAKRRETPARDVWLTPEADREMNRAATAMFAKTAVLCGLVFGAVFLLYRVYPRSFRYNLWIDGAAALAILLPFMLWYRALFLRLIRVADNLVQTRKYDRAVLALEPFLRFGNRSFDTDGRAHFLLAEAAERTGNGEIAERALAFLRRHRARSRWREEADRRWPPTQK